MYDFTQFIIEYLKSNFEDYSVEYGKDYNSEKEFPQITISVLNDEENQQFSDFQDERVTSCGLQVNWFAEATIIDDEIYDAQTSAIMIGDKIKQLFNKLRNERSNSNILTMRRVGTQAINPYDIGSQLYYGTTRFNFNISNPYTK